MSCKFNLNDYSRKYDKSDHKNYCIARLEISVVTDMYICRCFLAQITRKTKNKLLEKEAYIFNAPIIL